MSSFKLDEVSLGRLGRVILCTVVSLLAAISVMGSFAEGNVKPLLYAGAAGIGLLLWFAFDKFFWPVAVATLFFEGRFNFLPADLSVFQVAMIFGAVRFLVDFVAFRKTKIQRGPVLDQLLMVGFFAILFAHAAQDRLALRVFGSSLWGGRSYVTITCAFITYFIILTLPYDRKTWRLFPYMVLIPVTFDLGVRLVVLAAPGFAYRLSEYYTGFYSEKVLGVFVENERVGAWSSVGLLVTVSILAFVRINTLWRPEKWWALAVFLAGFLFTVLSGFRSAIVGWAVVVMAAAARDYRKAALAILPLIAIALLGLVLLHAVAPLPRAVQRGLTFLPGNWDPAVVGDANASLEFRKAIRTQWWERHFPDHPFFGRGFGFDPIWSNYDEQNQNTDFFEAIIQVGNFHNGMIAALDAVGIIGTVSLFLWCMLNLMRIFSLLLRVPAPLQPAILRWLSLYLIWLIVTNWMPLGGLSVSRLVEPFLVLLALFIKVATEEGFMQNGKIIVPTPGEAHGLKPASPARPLAPTLAGRKFRGRIPA